MSLKTLRSEVQRLLREDNRWRQSLNIGFVAGGVFLVTVAEIATNFADGAVKTVLATLWGVGAVMVFLGAFVFAFVDRGAAEALRLGLEAEERAQRLQDSLDERAAELEAIEDLLYRQTTLNSVATALREVAEEVLIKGAGTAQAQKARFERVLELLVINKRVLFNMGDERFNFAIYRFDDAKKLLVCQACLRPSRAESEKHHRDITPGMGHVGRVWMSRREAASEDVTKPAYQAMFDMPLAQGGKVDDAQIYRSIASVPIMLGTQPFGVLVATSDQVNRFWPQRGMDPTQGDFDTVEPLRVCAGVLAIIFGASILKKR